MIEEVAGAGDGELLRASDFEADGLAVSHRADAETPWLDVDSFIPKAGLCRGDSDGDWAGNVKVDEVVAGGSVGDVDRLIVDRYGEGGGAQLRRNRNRINARSGGDYAGEREHSRQEHTRSTQEAET